MIIKVDAASICGTDLHVFRDKPSVPTILGHEVCGTIVEMGKHANKSTKDNVLWFDIKIGKLYR